MGERVIGGSKQSHDSVKLLIVALCIFFVLSQVTIFIIDRSPWFDTAFSAETVEYLRSNGLTSINWGHYDVHPATSYILMYFWSFLNPGMGGFHWLQELSVVFMLGFFVFVYLSLRELFGRPGEWATVSLACLTTYAHYGTEVRMYSLLMMVSAVCFYAAVRRFEGKWLWIAMGAAFMLPMTHYIAVIAVVYAMMVYMIVGQKWYDGKLLLVGGSATIGVVISAMLFAIPQYLRIDRLWFFTMDMSSWPSSLLFGFFYPLGSGILPVIVYIGFLILLCIFGYLAFNLVMKMIEGKADDQECILLLMGSVAIVTAVGIELSKIVPVYHHRFFLVILWMFAAMVFVVFWKWVYGWWEDFDSFKTGWLLFAVPAIIVVFAVVGGMFVQYATHQQRELERIESSIPCQVKDQQLVVAEELWSMLPFRVYARENDCNWRIDVSTNLTKRQANSQGYDVVLSEDIYWDRTVPNESFWYAYGGSCGNDSECLGLFENRTSTIVRKDMGISLIYVGARQ